MHYNLAEKLAIIKAIDKVVRVDGHAHQKELKFVSRVMGVIKADQELLTEARNLKKKEGHSILKGMPENKKHALAVILEEIAGADGKVDEKEIKLILKFFRKAGIK